MEQHFEMLFKLFEDYGLIPQVNKLKEELKELDVALENIKRTPSLAKEHARELTSELADVLIMVYQIIVGLGMETVVDAMVEYKILRTVYEKRFEDGTT